MLAMFLPIFLVDKKIISRYDFVAPLGVENILVLNFDKAILKK